jgi:RNA polymerase sigma factor for flagellar operon FliA
VTEAPDSPEVLARFHEALDLVEKAVEHVSRIVGRWVEPDDLVSHGRQGLLEASRRYDPGRGVPFRAYASFRVRGAVIDGVRATSRIPRRAFARLRALESAARVSEGALEDVAAGQPPGTTAQDAERAMAEHLAGMATAMAMGLVAAPDATTDDVELDEPVDPEAAVQRAELLALVKREIGELPEQEAILVRRHYFDGERFDVVAGELGLSRSWASRLHTRAIATLTRKLRAKAR